MKRDSLPRSEQRFHATRFRGTAVKAGKQAGKQARRQAGKYGGAVTQLPTPDPVE